MIENLETAKTKSQCVTPFQNKVIITVICCSHLSPAFQKL